jgi:hypothetical protein
MRVPPRCKGGQSPFSTTPEGGVFRCGQKIFKMVGANLPPNKPQFCFEEETKRRVPTKKVTTLASIGAVLAVLAAPVQGEVVDNESIDLNLVFFVPCANGGAGELVDLNGPLHTLTTANINRNSVSGKTHSQPQGVSGVGLDTGDKYQGVGVTQDHFKGSFINGQFNEKFVNNFRIIGPGSGNNFLIHENLHLTIKANGEVTTTHDNFSADCK